MTSHGHPVPGGLRQLGQPQRQPLEPPVTLSLPVQPSRPREGRVPLPARLVEVGIPGGHRPPRLVPLALAGPPALFGHLQSLSQLDECRLPVGHDLPDLVQFGPGVGRFGRDPDVGGRLGV